MRDFRPDDWGDRARIGLLTPHADVVPEGELQALAPRGVSLHSARVPLGWQGGGDPALIGLDAVRAFAEPPDVDRAVAMLAGAPLDAIAYAFTSSAYVLGPEADDALRIRLEGRAGGIPVILPCQAAAAAMEPLEEKSGTGPFFYCGVRSGFLFSGDVMTSSNWPSGAPSVGATASRSRKVEARDIELFTQISGDRNPIHYDPGAAARSRFGEIVVQGGITTAILNAVVAEELPGPGTVFLEVHWRFTAPVRPGDTITGTVEVIEVREDKPITKLATRVDRDDGVTVIEGEATCYTSSL